ncbi:MAG: DUF1573 domain-containing protein [Bacteroidia bacterium]|nr:DUF1573 domain-containing protein [Bacteroidia bacterium]
MFKNTIIILALCFSIACGNKNQDKVTTDTINNPVSASNPEAKSEDNAPIMSFGENIHDFGDLTDGEVVTYKFKFKNTGNAALLISNASASCGCTIPSYPKEPLAPGSEAAIDVQFNSSGKVGKVEKTVTILSNTVPNQTYLIIKAEVKPK